MSDRDNMIEEEKKLIKELQTYGIDVGVTNPGNPDTIAKLGDPATGVAILMIDRGDQEHARMAAQTANDAIRANPKIKFMFSINGCGDDPREIDEIPEVRLALRTLFAGLRREAFHRFDPEHQALMLVATGYGRREGTNLIIPEVMIRRH